MKIPVLIFTVIVLAQSACSTNPYKTLELESGKVCALNYNYITLAPAIAVDKDGLIIKETTYFENISNPKKNFHCHFEVESSLKSSFPGLFVVIQNLHFRQDPESGECIDYIAFRPTDRNVFEEISNINLSKKRSKYSWTKFCGDVRAKRDGGRDYAELEGLSKAGFLTDNISAVEVEIYVRSPVVPSDGLELQILFTPYMLCKNSWSEYRECGRGKCIRKSLYNDSFVNCPFLNCPDEYGGCEVKIVGDELPADIRTKVTLTAVTSIFCSFFLFLGCVWCCKYFEILCWSASNLIGRPNTVELSPMTPPTPAGPASDPAPNKDLPPAYETLFPDR